VELDVRYESCFRKEDVRGCVGRGRRNKRTKVVGGGVFFV